MSKKDVNNTTPSVVAGSGAAGAGLGAYVGSAIGDFIEPIKKTFISDPNGAHILNNDGTVSQIGHTEIVNQSLHNAVSNASTITGAALLGAAGIAAGVYASRKNRNLNSRQFNK